jgi:hypothetical protein
MKRMTRPVKNNLIAQQTTGQPHLSCHTLPITHSLRKSIAPAWPILLMQSWIWNKMSFTKILLVCPEHLLQPYAHYSHFAKPSRRRRISTCTFLITSLTERLCIMGLHSALELRTLDSLNGVSQGLFVKKGCTVRKGERVWWLDGTTNNLRTYTKREILASSQSWLLSSKPQFDAAAAIVSNGSLCPSATTTCSDCSEQESPSSTASVSSCSESGLEMTADISDNTVGLAIEL